MGNCKIKIKKVLNIRGSANTTAIDIDEIRESKIELEMVADEMENQEEKSCNIYNSRAIWAIKDSKEFDTKIANYDKSVIMKMGQDLDQNLSRKLE